MTKKKTTPNAGLLSLLTEAEQDGHEMLWTKTNKYKDGLKKGNPAAAESKTKKSAEYESLWRKYALEVLKCNPEWDLEKVANYVSQTAKDLGHKMANGKDYKETYILSKIYGIKNELLQALKK